MKVLILSTYEKSGGAAIAANRLMNALNKNGVKASMLCRKSITWGPKALRKQSWTSIWERFVVWINNGFSMKNLWALDIANCGQDIFHTKEYQEADIVHLHWVNQGFLSLDAIEKIAKSGKKVVMTMHDMWYSTSICHHAYECESYKRHCRECKLMRMDFAKHLVSHVYDRKRIAYSKSDIEVVAVSRWLAGMARESGLTKDLHVSVVPNSISLTDFRLLDKGECRKELGIATDRYVIVFCAARLDEKVKRMNLLLDALNVLVGKHTEWKERIELRLIGGMKDKSMLDAIPVAYSYLGVVRDVQKMNKEYSAADIVASTSYYETFGQTLAEAQASGCMPVAFDGSGPSDIIDHKRTGFLVREQTADAFAEGLEWALTEGRLLVSPLNLRISAKEKYSEESIANMYVQIYNRKR